MVPAIVPALKKHPQIGIFRPAKPARFRQSLLSADPRWLKPVAPWRAGLVSYFRVEGGSILNEVLPANPPEWPECLKAVFPRRLPDWPVEAWPPPRELRSAHLSAHDVLSRLDNFAVEEWGFKSGQLIQELFIPIWLHDINPDEPFNQWKHLIEHSSHPSMVAAQIAAMMCASAFRAYNDGKTEVAWTYVMDAETWYGTLCSGTTAMIGRETAISQKASQAAKSKNAPARAWVRNEWNNRNDKDQGKAAFARVFVLLVKKQFDLKVTAETIARDWLPKEGS